ncbi:hypothetical protein CF326_g3244 [Tilletia indica]|nr:hypothetical protein CF326_g3244 [Tilletia indica]
MPGPTDAEPSTPSIGQGEMSAQLLAALSASTAAVRSFEAKFEKVEQDIADLKKSHSLAVAETSFGMTMPMMGPSFPTIAPSGVVSTPALRAGMTPGFPSRPGQTPSTPKVRGASGFLVPATPKRSKEAKNVGIGLAFGSPDVSAPGYEHLDARRSADERINASRRASDETSKEVVELKAQLWSTCLAIVEREHKDASPDVLVSETDKMVSTHWLQIRKDRISRMFDSGSRADPSRDNSKSGGGGSGSAWNRKISQTVAGRITKLTHENFYDWVSEILGVVATIPFATEILEGIEHGQDYDPAEPNTVTDNYDPWLDLEIGGLIGGSVSAECRGYIFSRQSSGEFRGSVIWRDLNAILQRGDQVGRSAVKEKVFAEKQKPSEGVRPYAERLRALFIKSAAMGKPFDQEDQVFYLLRGVGRHLETTKDAIRTNQDRGPGYSFDSALQQLVSKEANLAHDHHPARMLLLSRPAANLASESSSGARRFHIVRNTASKGTPGYFNGECRHCHKWGHKFEDCAQRKREIDAGLVTPKASANVAQSNEEEEQDDPLSDCEGEIYQMEDENGEIFFARLATTSVGELKSEGQAASAMIAVASQAATVEAREWTPADLEAFTAASIPEKAIKWILDSGATHHMTSRSELLPVRLAPASDTVVHIADGTQATVSRRGACMASLFGDGGSEATAFLKTVLVVPSFTNNLLSVQRLAEDGWTVQFTKAGAELRSPTGQKVQTFTEPGTGAPYLMLKTQPTRVVDIKGASKRGGPAKATARVAMEQVRKEIEQKEKVESSEAKPKERSTTEAKKWHRRLAHMSYFLLRILARNPAFAREDRPKPQDITEIITSEEVCDPCVESKQPLMPFGTSDSKPQGKMDDIHFDLTGQFEGNKDYKYGFHLLDEYSRMVWSFPVPNKEAATVFAVFLTWTELMKNQNHGTIKRLHCDHGGEFENHLFQEWARINGVGWNFAAPNTSQQNGLIERWNRTIQDRARAMLRAARLSDSFWPYAFRAACDILNKSPCSAIGNAVPLTLWSKDPVDYDTIRVFGCLSWVIKPNKNRKNKLSVRAVRGTYLGPAPEHKAYLVYTPAERPHLRISPHVVFDENRTYDARFTLDDKQVHSGQESDVLELVAPRRGNKLSEIPIELDPAPEGAPVLDLDEDDDGEGWDDTVDNAIATGQTQGDEEDNWPGLGSLFGEDDDVEDLVTNEWTGELNRLRTPETMPPSVYGIRNSYPELDGLDSPISMGDLDNLLQDTPTKTVIDPSVGAMMEAAQPPRRSKRIQSQFKALTSRVELALTAVIGEELCQSLAAQVLGAAIRSSADGVQIEPKSLAEAKARSDWDKWEAGMKEEMSSLESMKTWSLTDLPAGRKPVGCRWTYKLKLDAEGKATRWKSRLVAQGFSQRPGVDYNETFAPVARLTTVRILVALAIRHKMSIWSMDVVTAYLNGTINEDIYMLQPPHFNDGTERVCKLHRSLYGLKQSGREWFTVVAAWLKGEGFKALQSEPCVFTKVEANGEPVTVLLYVDDVLILAKHQRTIDGIRSAFTERFKMTDNGPLTQVLGLKIGINHSSGLATISQEAYIKSLVQRFGLEDANAVDTPMTAALQGIGPRTDGQATAAEITLFACLIGCLMWAAQGTRPDIAYAVSRLARFMSNPRPEHIIGAKRLVRYLKGTSSIGLVYTCAHDAQIEGFCDADHAKDPTTRRSVSGYAFFIHGNLISWRSRLQATVAISSTESEYMAMSEAAREAKWVRTFTTELHLAPRRATDIFTDSSGAYSLARNPEGHNRLKHVDTHHHFVRELVASQQVNVTQIGTDDNAADIFTKVTSIARLHEGMIQLGLGDNRRASA